MAGWLLGPWTWRDAMPCSRPEEKNCSQSIVFFFFFYGWEKLTDGGFLPGILLNATVVSKLNTLCRRVSAVRLCSGEFKRQHNGVTRVYPRTDVKFYLRFVGWLGHRRDQKLDFHVHKYWSRGFQVVLIILKKVKWNNTTANFYTAHLSSSAKRQTLYFSTFQNESPKQRLGWHNS